MLETCQVLLFLFSFNTDQFWFLLMLRTFSSKVRQEKKTLQGNANCSSPKTVIGMTKASNKRYLPYLKLCGKASMWICMYSQKWPKMEGENYRVLRLSWIHKLAMYQVTFQFQWHFSFSDLLVLMTFQFWWHISDSEIQFLWILVLSDI